MSTPHEPGDPNKPQSPDESIRSNLHWLHDASDWMDRHLTGLRLSLLLGMFAVSGVMFSAWARTSPAFRRWTVEEMPAKRRAKWRGKSLYGLLEVVERTDSAEKFLLFHHRPFWTWRFLRTPQPLSQTRNSAIPIRWWGIGYPRDILNQQALEAKNKLFWIRVQLLPHGDAVRESTPYKGHSALPVTVPYKRKRWIIQSLFTGSGSQSWRLQPDDWISEHGPSQKHWKHWNRLYKRHHKDSELSFVQKMRNLLPFK